MKPVLKGLKEINYKDFLLRHGQWVALGVGAVFLVPLLILGASSAVTSDSPAATAKGIKDLASGVEQQIKTGPASPGVTAQVDPKLMDRVQNDPVERELYLCGYPLFITTTLEDLKRRNPEILTIASARWDYIQGSMMGYDIIREKDEFRIAALVPKDKSDIKLFSLDPKKNRQLNAVYKILSEASSRGGSMGGGGMGGGGMGGGGMMGGGMGGGGMGGGGMMGGGMRGGMGGGGMMGGGMGGGGMMGGGMGGGGMMGGGMGGGGMGGGGMMGSGGVRNIQQGTELKEEKYDYRYIPLEEKMPDKAKYAEVVWPVRMVQFTASFPYKQQLENYRRALKKASLADLLQDKDDLPVFHSVKVQRRTLRPDGTKLDAWQDLDVREAKKGDKVVGKQVWVEYRWLLSRAVETEADEKDFKDTVILKDVSKNLAMPRPKLARDAKYPPVKLAEIEETVKKFAKADRKANTTKNPLAAKVKGDFEEFESDEGGKGNEAENNQTEIKTNPEEKKEPDVPEFILVRFFDVLVRPGDIYEYRVQIRTANPNKGKKDVVVYESLADRGELESPWSWDDGQPENKRIIVPVPPETYLYALERGHVDRSALQKYRPDPYTAYLQIQRWTPAFKPDSVPQPLPVGEWSIADIGVHRGEYVGHLEAVDLPLWVPTKESYELARVKDKRIRGTQKAPIDFSTYAVLVDFEGGKGYAQQVQAGKSKTVTDDSDLEMLLYVPDANGNYRLIVRSSQADINDPQRKERHDQWTKWIEEVKLNKQKPGGAGQDDPFKTKPKGKP